MDFHHNPYFTHIQPIYKVLPPRERSVGEHNSNFTMVGDISIVNGLYKPIYNVWGAPPGTICWML
jgi:hypothetical protein